MSWLKRVFGSQSSQETKVYYEKSKGEREKKEEKHQISTLKIDEANNENSQESDNSWFSSWIGLSKKLIRLKAKRKNLVMTMKRKTNGGAHFAAKRETKAKASPFSLPNQAARANQPKQQTYQCKLALIRTIITKMMKKIIARSSFLLKHENTKNLNSFTYFLEKNK